MMEFFICLCSTIGMIAIVSLICLYLKKKFEYGEYICLAFYICFPMAALFFWFTSSIVTLDRKDLPEKLRLTRDSLRKAQKENFSLEKQNDSLILVLDGKRKERLINSLDNDTYKEIFGEDKPTTDDEVSDNTVYICTGGNAYRYHSNKYCNGLSRCSGEIEEISEEEAESMGRTPCHLCY